MTNNLCDDCGDKLTADHDCRYECNCCKTLYPCTDGEQCDNCGEESCRNCVNNNICADCDNEVEDDD